MASENLHFTPLYINNDELTPHSGDKTVWVVMRSRKEKAAADDGSAGNKASGAKRLYGYERIQNMVPAFFMPMKESVTTKGGRRIKRTAPAIPDIFFVKDTIEHLDTIVKRGIGVEYLFVKGHPYRQPVIIRDSEMENFIAATTASQRVTFHTAGSDTLSRLIGRRVRIPHADGFIEGELLTVRGSRYRRLRVSLPASSIVAYIDLTLSPDTIVETMV